jgi:hypothetical protein
MQMRLRLAFGLVGVAALSMPGCGGSKPAAVEPMEIASNAGSQAIAQYDANGDQSLDYNELAKAPGLRAAMVSIKKQKPQGNPPPESQLQGLTITASEIDARIQEWKDKKIARVLVNCRVTRGKKGIKGRKVAIDGAEVKFVPESFLGPSLTPATGKTNKNGFASPSQLSRGGNDPATGMAPGFYRVEITKGSEIPAKYNSATTLGAEVPPDGLISFELDY